MPRFVLEGPRPCTIFCAHALCMNYITKMFLLVSSSVSSTQQLCFVQVQGQKREQKHTTKNFVEYYNNPLLLTMPRLRLLELTLVKLLDLKVAVSLMHSTFKGCSTHKSVGPWGLLNPFLVVQVWNVYQDPHHKPSILSNLKNFRDRIPDIVCFIAQPDS